jgi:hypothetical protein
MRWLLTIPVVASSFLGIGFPTDVERPVPALQDSALALTITRDGRATEASCVLLKRVDQPGRVTLYFATAARLFRRHDGAPLPPAQSIVVNDGRAELDVIPTDVTWHPDSLSDLAVLRVVVPHSSFEARSITFDIPSAGSVFLIAGRDASGRGVVHPQRVGYSPSGLVVGDRATTAVPRCLGAPAESEAGIFGIVSVCEPGTPPAVATFLPARGWLTRHVPGILAVPSVVPKRFETSLQQFNAPLLVESCSAAGSYEVDVPMVLRSDEVAVDARASVFERDEWPIGDLTVAGIGSQFLKLRFVLTAAPRALLPETCRHGQPLANVQLTVVKVPR